MKKCRMFIMSLLFTVIFCTGCGEKVVETIGDIRKPDYIEVTVDETVFEDKFYYNQLSEKEHFFQREKSPLLRLF